MIYALIIAIVALLGFLFYASYAIGSSVYLKALCRLDTQERVVALTFDDGIDAQQTPLVLDVLKRHKAPATFFLIGQSITDHRDIVARMIAEGHMVGNHSYRHCWNFPLSSGASVERELRDTDAALKAASKRDNHLFRPPFGVTNPIIGRVVRRLGYTTIGWSIRSLDTQRSHEAVLRAVEGQLHPGAIILLHDRLVGSEILLEKILDLLAAKGYRVVPIIE